MAHRSAGHVLLLCAGTALVAYAGCSSEDPAGTTSGTSTSTSDAASSSTTASTGMFSSSSSGLVTSSGTGGMTSNLGEACATDAQCGPDLTCIKADAMDPVFGGGPAGGYCSKVCSSDADCPDVIGACATPGSGKPGLCLLTCEIGPALMYLNDELSPDKCHGRNDLRCIPLNAGSTVCLPTCGKDEQCPAGRVCDPRLAVCVDTPSTGKPAGAKCDPKAATPECAGICLSFSSGETMCSQACVLGGDPSDPTNTPNCGGVESGLCAYSPQGNGAGDYGFCALACTQHDQCQNPTFWCFGIGGLTGTEVSNGYCFGADKCPNGPSDCQQGVCTDTKYGPFCLDAAFPLGDAAPVGTGSTTSSSGTGGTGGMGTTSGTGGTGGMGTTSSTGGTGGMGTTSGTGGTGGTGGTSP